MLARWEAHKRKYFANLPRELTSVQQRGRSVNQYPELPRGPSREVFASDRRVHAVSSPNRTSSRVLNVNSTNPATESSTQRSQGSATSHGRVFAHQLCGRWTCYLKSKITPKTHKVRSDRRCCFILRRVRGGRFPQIKHTPGILYQTFIYKSYKAPPN